MDRVRRLTDPPDHHFFGYYEKSPWNADESLLLAHETGFQDRRPDADDAAGIRLIEDGSGEGERVAETRAWDFQQGAMLQWLGPGFDRRFAFNDRTETGFVTRIHDVEAGCVRTVDRPIYAVAPDGETAFTLEYARLDHTRPGYGYVPLDDAKPAPRPDDEGVYRVDLTEGSSSLLVSLADLAAFDPVPSMEHGTHWVNHIQVSPGGERVAFIHRSETPDDRRWLDRLFAMDADGGADPVGRGVLPPDGHCSFSPDGEWLLLDSSPDEERRQGLYLYDWPRGERVDLGSVHSLPVEDSSLRCDLHPRWDRTGERICFDSTHEGSRQMYVLDVSEYTG